MCVLHSFTHLKNVVQPDDGLLLLGAVRNQLLQLVLDQVAGAVRYFLENITQYGPL